LTKLNGLFGLRRIELSTPRSLEPFPNQCDKQVVWDGAAVAAHPSEGPLEADGRRTHAFTVNLGRPDMEPHLLEVRLRDAALQGSEAQ
jgi:hypothetical protein